MSEGRQLKSRGNIAGTSDGTCVGGVLTRMQASIRRPNGVRYLCDISRGVAGFYGYSQSSPSVITAGGRGGQGRSRTADLPLFRRTLYQLSYLTGRTRAAG